MGRIAKARVRADGEAVIRDALGDDVLLVPYVKPGFDLAVVCARMFRAFPTCRAMVLMQHGLFTWGDTAKEAYDSHIELVSVAEAYLASRPPATASLGFKAAVSPSARWHHRRTFRPP